MTTAYPLEIFDSKGHQYKVYTNSEDEYFEVCLIDRRWHVGYVRCTIDGSDEMILCDITVLRDALIRRNMLQKIWDRLHGVHPKRKNYQGIGLGTILLRMACDEARRRKVKRIIGTIVDRDIRNNPRLTEWYSKHGFTISPAEPGDLPGAIYRVTRIL